MHLPILYCNSKYSLGFVYVYYNSKIQTRILAVWSSQFASGRPIAVLDRLHTNVTNLLCVFAIPNDHLTKAGTAIAHQLRYLTRINSNLEP